MHIMEIIRDFEIAHSTGYFIGDNAGSNGTCIEHLSRHLFTEYGIKFEPKKRRIRCLGHIINLSLSAFLFADNKKSLDEAIQEAIDNEGDTTLCAILIEQRKAKKGKKKARDDFIGWREVGALGKLHNIAVRIRRSSILSDHWRSISPMKVLGIDNVTRWNSWYLLIKVAIDKRPEIELMCTNVMDWPYHDM
jgi:hypothetical protein